MNNIFITGGTGYMGRRLVNILLIQGYKVTALVRRGSENKLPAGCNPVMANPFDALSFGDLIPPGCTFVQLLGVHHPGPSKKEEFKTIDLASVKASATAAEKAGVKHFVYVSVAQTHTSIMYHYQQCRALGEDAIKAANIPATFIRPWYVIGPGHYWPLMLAPFFKILEWVPSTSAKAKALRLVSLQQMLNALVYAIKNPPQNGVEIMEIEAIRNF